MSGILTRRVLVTSAVAPFDRLVAQVFGLLHLRHDVVEALRLPVLSHHREASGPLARASRSSVTHDGLSGSKLASLADKCKNQGRAVARVS